MKMAPKTFVAALLLAAVLAAPMAHAQQGATVSVAVKNHRFQPKQITARANAPISIRVKNNDPSRMEFESSNPSVEKVIAGNSEAVVKIGPLAPGRYEFFDDFNQQDTLVLVVR
jgi:Ni/Co efflux regulator RcnB